ncbi:hypothetical protein AB0D65_06950 [Streptomyces griseoloalbus]|uniref:Polymerase nucleotidyl transferase domain-containing protein n=1 Tax=Streptomyces griseoloalbus TaxID=67303 RepID=A0ABV3E0S6_9ACTN
MEARRRPAPREQPPREAVLSIAPSTPSAASASDDLLRTRLEAFLTARSFGLDDLVEETDQGHGEPVLAVAAGSVLAGFGTHKSDLDLLVLVDNDRVTRMPITSHRFGTLVDVTVRAAVPAKAAAEKLTTTDWPTLDRVDNAGWNHHRRSLNTTSRMALGLPLKGGDEWLAWQRGLRGPWLGRVLHRWWVAESVRMSTAARWLAPANPALALLRARDAVLHALHARATEAGQWYFNAKWLPEKLRVLDDGDGLAKVTALLAGRVTLDTALSWADDLLGAVGRWDAAVHWAPGVSTWPVDTGTVVDRWGVRAVQTPLSGLPAAPGDGAVWTGPADAPPPEVRDLFAHDMLWLGVAPAVKEAP